MRDKKLKSNFLDRIILIAIIVAIVLLILNNVMLFERKGEIEEAKDILEEELRPAELNIIKITQENCDFCFDLEKVIGELKGQNVKIVNEETVPGISERGKELISKYDIKKIPTMIVSGEVNKSKQLTNYFEQKGEITNNEFIYTSITPLYFDVLSKQIKGKVKIKHLIDSSCKECVDLAPISSALEKQGVFIQEEEFVEFNSEEGKELIDRFDIKKIPTIFISDEIDFYTSVKEALIQSGAINKEEFYLVSPNLPPYREISQDKVVGLVDVVYLTKKDCATCYDVSANKNILLRFGMALNDENTYDIDSPNGKQLVQKYNIKKVPIIILSPDSEYYPSLVQAWKSVGTVENDGWFVMRNPEVIGNSWDLENDKEIEVE